MATDSSATRGLLDRVRREVDRNAVRARNGVLWFAGAEFAPKHPTASDVVWRQGKAHVRRYRSEATTRFRTPVVCYLGLVGQSYVFDLYDGGSIVQMLMDWGYDAYVLDWGTTDELDADNTLELYLQSYLPRALEAICAESGSPDVNVLAYCMGGLMTVEALAAQPDLPIRSVVTLAAPYDFTQMGAMVDVLREGKVEPDDLLDSTGNLPAGAIRESFKRRKPTGDLVNYANLWQNLWNDEYVEGYQAIGRFLGDHIPLPGMVFREMAQNWLRDNGFVTNRLRLGGRKLDLADVRRPILAVVAELDDIVVESSATALVQALPHAEVELLRVDAGHVSLFAGRKAVKVVMPKIFQWIEEHSEVRA